MDTLVLGCTHYPLLAEVIQNLMGPSVTLVDAGAEAAKAVEALLAERDALAERPRGTSRYFTSEHPDSFLRLAPLFLGEDVTGQVEEIDITQY